MSKHKAKINQSAKMFASVDKDGNMSVEYNGRTHSILHLIALTVSYIAADAKLPVNAVIGDIKNLAENYVIEKKKAD